jgi:hypothetical protein
VAALEQLIKILKLSPIYVAAIALFSALALIAPNALLEWFGVLDKAQHYRQWISVAFLAAVSLLAVHLAVEIGRVVRNRTRRREAHELALKRLHRLTEGEKQILRFYVSEQTKTNKLRATDGVVNGLVDAGLIYLATDLWHPLMGLDHNISEFAWEYLNAHPDLLDGTTRTCRSDKVFNRF